MGRNFMAGRTSGIAENYMMITRMRIIARHLKPYKLRNRDRQTSGNLHWHFIGDSHVNAFRWADEQGLFDRPSQFTIVGGATAVGLRNPNSLTNAIEVFTQAVSPYDKNKIPVIQLGEVDCGFVIWYRAQKYGESIEDQLNYSMAAYLEFVDSLKKIGYQNIVLTSATLPSILDDQNWGEVANARREVKATLRERTDLTLRYNDKLREATESRALHNIDLSNVLLDRSTGLISSNFRHPDPTDHHLDPVKVGKLWAAALNRLAI
jgi:hypothetical protein